MAVEETGPIVISSVRRDLFGAAWDDCVTEGMRRARHWKTCELELFAAFVSKLNSCGF